jgi:probable HAF family extracellular repeat protein
MGLGFREAKAINDKGEVVVIGDNDNHQERAFLLTPDAAATALPNILAPSVPLN